MKMSFKPVLAGWIFGIVFWAIVGNGTAYEAVDTIVEAILLTFSYWLFGAFRSRHDEVQP